MLNVHALGGRAMMRAAREALANRADAPKLIAVTVLTSLDEADFADLGLSGGRPGRRGPAAGTAGGGMRDGWRRMLCTRSIGVALGMR